MGKKSSPTPPAPVKVDPWKTAESQYEFGKQAALYNKRLAESTWQETPYGTLRYETVPQTAPQRAPRGPREGLVGSFLNSAIFGGSPPRTLSEDTVPTTKMIQELHPAEQALLDQQRTLKGQYGDLAGQLMGKTEGLFSTPVDMSSLGEMPGVNEATRQNVLESILGRFQPQQSRDRAAFETQLANQGFVRGSTAWDSAMDEMGRREADFRLAANVQAGNESRADLAQRLGIRQQGVQELLLPRNQTLQELSTFMTGSQPTMPQFQSVSAPQVSAPDYAGLALGNAQMQNQANMAQYNAQMANQDSGLGGLGSLLGTAAGFAFGGPAGAGIGSNIGGSLGGGGTSIFSGAMPGGATSAGGWSF